LHLLAKDISIHPERLQAIDAQTVAALQTLVQGVDIDLDALLPPDGPAASAPTPP
jgi:antitoxin PrlF